MKHAVSHPWGSIVCAVLFLSLAYIFIDRAGLQTDEVLFAGPLFRAWRFFPISVGHRLIPLMNMSYVGAFKTWLYASILLIFGPNPVSIRLPAILLGAVTIALFWALLCRVHSPRSAWVGCLLLATDPSFILTTVYDIGPVALEHLLLVTAVLLALRWFRTGSPGALAAAAFCCGLGLWDKAVFVWVFTGILAGALLFASAIRKRLTWPALAIATGALCLGALPLIFYNVAGPEKFATIRSNTHLDTGFTPEQLMARKFSVLRATWDGSVLFGYIVNEDSAPLPRPPQSKLERVSFGLHALAGEHRRNGIEPAFCAGLLLVPLLWRTRARPVMLFCLIAILVAWMEMAMNAGTGGAAHHAVVLWPLPHLFLAVAFAEASTRFRWGAWGLAAVVGFLAIGNVLVVNQYLYQFVRNGAAGSWTDAVYSLADDLKRSHASQIVLPDWGLIDSLCVLDRETSPTRSIDVPFDDPRILSDPSAIWVKHTPGNESFAGINQRVLEAARRAGFDPVPLHTYADRNGRPMFQTFRFRKRI